MRTVKKNFVHRLEAQAKEADIQGLSKISSHLGEIVKNQKVRDNDSSYVYSRSEFHKDVEKLLWKAAVRAADFYDCYIDAVQAQEVIESAASDFIHEMMNISGVEHGVGAHEPNVPGETSKYVSIEVGEE